MTRIWLGSRLNGAGVSRTASGGHSDGRLARPVAYGSSMCRAMGAGAETASRADCTGAAGAWRQTIHDAPGAPMMRALARSCEREQHGRRAIKL
jgi:hypothetical protein